jgi:galactoside O-acetyltransferase
LGKNVKIAKNCTIVNVRNISIGSNVRIDSYTLLIAGSNHVSIGNYVHIGGSSYLAGGEGLTMADFSGLSQGVRIYTASDDYAGVYFTNPTLPAEYTRLRRGAVRLEKHAVVGSGTIILPGCILAEGTSVGALSVIRKSTQPWQVYFGNPAKPIMERKRIDPDGMIEKELLENIRKMG